MSLGAACPIHCWEQHRSINLAHYEENQEHRLVAKGSLEVRTHLAEGKDNSAPHPGILCLTLISYQKRTASRLFVGTSHKMT